MITIFLVALVGGLLGVAFMVTLRQSLIVEEHGKLPFPEGTACAEVILAGEEGGSKAGTVFSGLGIAAAYKFIADGLKVFPSEIGYDIKAYAGSSVGVQVLPALAGVGYICGPKISSYMLAGSTLSWRRSPGTPCTGRCRLHLRTEDFQLYAGRKYIELVCTDACHRTVRCRCTGNFPWDRSDCPDGSK